MKKTDILKDLTFFRADRGQKKCGGQADAPFDALHYELLFFKIDRKMSSGSQNYCIFPLFMSFFLVLRCIRDFQT